MQNQKDLNQAYSKAISDLSNDLSNALYGRPTANTFESLMAAKGKLDTTIKELKNLRTAQDAEKKANKAVKDFDAADKAMTEALTALENAQEALKNAPTNCELKDLEALDEAIRNLPPVDDGTGDTGDTGAADVDDDDEVAGAAGETETVTPAEVEVLDELVPLAAGPVTRAQFVNYLYVRQGSPETELSDFADVSEDHEYALALGWGQSIGLISGNEGNNFYPDELVTVAAAREFLGSYAKVIAAGAVAADSLSSLTGEDDEAVLNCDEVLAEFFGEPLPVAEPEKDIAA